MKSALDSDPKLKARSIKQVSAVIVFKLHSDDKKSSKAWFLDLKNDGSVGVGERDDADATLSLSESNFAKLVSGKTPAQRLFMSGNLKVQGNVMKAVAIEGVLKAAKAKL